MNCKKCGAPLIIGDQFCKSCGASVNETSTSNQNMGGFIPNQNAEQPAYNQNTGSFMPNQNTEQPAYNQNMGSFMPNQNTEQPAYNQNTGSFMPNQNTEQPVYNQNMGSFVPNQDIEQPVYSQNVEPTVQYTSPKQDQFGGQANDNYYDGSNNGQPSWANVNNSQSKSSNGNLKYIIIAVIVLIAIIIGVIGIFGKKVFDGSNALSKSTYKVNFKGFNFDIPDDLIYEKNASALSISNEDGTWVASIELGEGNFSQLKAKKSQLKQTMEKGGYTSSMATEKTYSGVDFITLEVSANGTNAIIALAKANSMNYVGVTLMDQDNKFDYSLMQTIAPIIKSISYAGETNNMKINTKIDLSKIEEFAK